MAVAAVREELRGFTTAARSPLGRTSNMASISRDPNGRRRILFVDADGNRKTIRLGKTSQRMAEEIKIKVETLNAAKIGGCSLDRETAAWVANLGDDLHAKLAAAGLAEPRRTARLGAFLEAFIANRIPSAAPNTIMNLNQSKRRLIEHFGADRDMRSITPADADGWAAALAEKYAPATAGRTIKRARQFFKLAIRDKIVTENPFAGVKASGQPNKERQFHIGLETIASVIDAAPDHEWRLIIALSRFGGLRCPSEHLALRWQDMDWERNRFRVDSPKTGERWIPMFPELRPHLEAAFELAEDGAVYCINRYRDSNTNLRTTFTKIIRRAGAKPWPKLFHNLRASRETELAATYPIHVVCEWIGNSAAIAAKHYLTVREEDFERAAQGGAKSGALEAQNRAQQPSASTRNKPQDSMEEQEACGVVRENAIGCGDTLNYLLPPAGLEPTTVALEERYSIQLSYGGK
jgi:integrase